MCTIAPEDDLRVVASIVRCCKEEVVVTTHNTHKKKEDDDNKIYIIEINNLFTTTTVCTTIKFIEQHVGVCCVRKKKEESDATNGKRSRAGRSQPQCFASFTFPFKTRGEITLFETLSPRSSLPLPWWSKESQLQVGEPLHESV